MQAGGPDGFETYAAEPRTSMMAVASLVLGILSMVTCCVGIGAITGVPAAGLGIGSLLVMNSKRGALSGRGMAISGIVMGTIGLFASIVVWIGVATYVNGISTVVTPAINGAEALDVRPIKEMLTAEAAAKLDEPKLIAFRNAYQDRLGKFQKTDTNLLNYIKTAYTVYTSDPKGLEQMLKTKGGVPLPMGAYFDKGHAQIWLLVPQQVKSKGKPSIFIDMAVVPDGGTPIFLIGDDAASTPATPGTAPTPPANPDPKATPAPTGTPDAPAPEPATPPTGG